MKWSLAQNDYLSLSVADSDLKHPQKINDGLIKFTKDKVFGYTHTTESYYEALQSWY